MRRFELLIFDTYDVTFRRSPRYLEDPLVEAVDEATRDAVDEPRLWSRLARRHALTETDIELVQDRLAGKYCKNLDIWKELHGWAGQYRLVLLHPGPAGLLERWRAEYALDDAFHTAAGASRLNLGRGDAALYARIASDAGLPPERCLLIDDERGPFEAAREAGLGAYRFGSVYGLRTVLADPAAAFDRPV